MPSPLRSTLPACVRRLLPAQQVALRILQVGFGAVSCIAPTSHILMLLRKAVLAM
jgi:hypothetical protein